MRSSFVIVILLALALAIVASAQPASALPILSVPYFKAGPAFYLNPSMEANLVIIEANTSQLASADDEALAVSFVPTGNPGGLVATPIIAQTSSQSIFAAQTYFYQDFLPGF